MDFTTRYNSRQEALDHARNAFMYIWELNHFYIVFDPDDGDLQVHLLMQNRLEQPRWYWQAMNYVG